MLQLLATGGTMAAEEAVCEHVSRSSFLEEAQELLNAALTRSGELRDLLASGCGLLNLLNLLYSIPPPAEYDRRTAPLPPLLKIIYVFCVTNCGPSLTHQITLQETTIAVAQGMLASVNQELPCIPVR